MSHTPSSSLEMLRQQLEAARSHDESVRQHNTSGNPLNVPGAGKVLSSAYEQLRNAAEYSEEHLVLQGAIRRFYRRTLFLTKQHPKHVGHELMVELTQSGYLNPKSFSTQTADSISQLASEYLHVHGRLRQAHVPNNKALDWVLAVLSVRTENLLNPHSHHTVFANFAYNYFLQALPRDRHVKNPEEQQLYEISLYVAVHQALLKSDIDVVRTELLNLYRQTPDDIHNYVAWNEKIHEIYLSELTQRLKRTIFKNGAPFRILRSLMDDSPNLHEVLPNRDQFLEAYDRQINSEYQRTERRLNNGILKSIIFLLITKSIIGVAIEIPYDLIVHDAIAWAPLIINLLFPPIYMASVGLSLKLPNRSDAAATKQYIDQVLYGDGQPGLNTHERTKRYSPFAKLIFTLLFFIPLSLTFLLLNWLEFNVVQMIIFFVFFSTASFLGFRLRSMIRELKMGGQGGGLISLTVDFFYLPFIVLGQWLSSKYAKVNIVGKFLDIAIEMPLKTVLRLIRQWMRFLNEKHEEIY